MDLSKDVVLKENYCFLVADEAGQMTGGEHGLYSRDTRFLSCYSWSLATEQGAGLEALMLYTPRPDTLEAHYSLIEGPSQRVGLGRQLCLRADGLTDTLTVSNTSLDTERVTLKLDLATDFADMFEARGWQHMDRPPVVLEALPEGARFAYTAQDGLRFETLIEPSHAPTQTTTDSLVFAFSLAPQASWALTLKLTLKSPFKDQAGISYDAWLEGFGALGALSEPHQRVLAQAQQDLRALLLFTDYGPYVAAGIPWFVAAFGRDALLSASMLLPHHPDVAEGALRFLAAHQGQKHDSFCAEAPGKIMHELRYGELTRLGKMPFGPYYGTVDATALFIVLLHQLYRVTGDKALIRELAPNWQAALAWILSETDEQGFLTFTGVEQGQGLSVQSWKDSHDSMSYRDGALARGAIAGSEVQGYVYAAYLAAAEFCAVLDTPGEAWLERAQALKDAFHQAFWLPELQTYAMALGGDGRPLAVHNSNAGQLLWSGIVPEKVAPRLVASLFNDANWSGWGIRTLGSAEVRYNPLSYHNGSVWPHDNALIAGGLARYGFKAEAARIRTSLYDLAASQRDHRLPELVAGYTRSDAPPVPYPVACRPQAWDAAALVYLSQF